uniref:Uncharacterized protein n=1 Tax=Physcomitrium patens TaxID=3218 RepID=A0A2K1K5T1_PHYPA|nr:hypothetical protein PHYPA_011032 [Physcomitrium patens]
MTERVMIPQTAYRDSGTIEPHKWAIPGMPKKPAPKSGRRGSFIGRRFNNDYNKVQPSKSLLESPELETFNTDAISEDDSSVFTASTRTSNTISDDDSLVLDFGRASADLGRASIDFAPARHSTACCTDLAFRRELRRRFQFEPPLDESTGLRNSFAMGHSFRRELEKEDCVESLALWEETEAPASRDRVVQKGTFPHPWHGDTASTGSSRNGTLESLFRKPKKSFLNGLFSGLNFTSTRRSRKS